MSISDGNGKTQSWLFPSITGAILIGVILWAGTTIQQLSLEVVKIQTDVSHLSRIVTKQADQIEQILTVRNNIDSQFRLIESRINRLWEVFRHQLKEDKQGAEQ